MSKSNRDNRKSRGRPKTTGTGTLIGVRILDAGLATVDSWIKAQYDTPSRPEAIRRLVELGLAKDSGEKPTHMRPPRAGASVAGKSAAGLGKTSKKSSEMAGEAIDQLSDAAATDDERARRKRRLIKGPTEFREMRGRKPKA